MKKTIFIMLSVIALIALSAQPIQADDKKEPITKKVLVDNQYVTIYEVTFQAGAVTDWHSHPQHTAYAITDAKLMMEEKDKPNQTIEIKAGDAQWMPAVTHKTTNVGNKACTVIVTEIKDQPHKH